MISQLSAKYQFCAIHSHTADTTDGKVDHDSGPFVHRIPESPSFICTCPWVRHHADRVRGKLHPRRYQEGNAWMGGNIVRFKDRQHVQRRVETTRMKKHG